MGILLETNVLLVGSNGHGKSALGNWIHDFGQAEYPLFAEGDTEDPSKGHVVLQRVQVCPEGPLASKGDPRAVTFNLIDTPGLYEEKGQNDMKRMGELLQLLHEIKHVSCVVLCIDFGFRQDSRMVAMLKYFQKLFHPLFQAGNVMIVFTKVDPSVYKSEDWSKALDARYVTIKDILKQEVHNVFALSSVFPDEKLSKHINREAGTLLYPAKKSLLHASLEARSQFITQATQFKPISLEGHSFPLPLCLHVRKMNCLREATEKLIHVNVNLHQADQDYNVYVQQEAKLTAEIEKLSIELEDIDQEIEEKSQIQRTPFQLLHEKNAKGKLQNLKFELPLPDFEVLDYTHNCKYTLQRPTTNVLEVVPEPYFFARKQTELPDGSGITASWFIQIQLAYSGTEFFKTRLQRLSADKTRLESEHAAKKHRKEDVERRREKVKIDAETHLKQKQELEQQKDLFSRENFELSQIPDFIRLLGISDKAEFQKRSRTTTIGSSRLFSPPTNRRVSGRISAPTASKLLSTEALAEKAKAAQCQFSVLDFAPVKHKAKLFAMPEGEAHS